MSFLGKRLIKNIQNETVPLPTQPALNIKGSGFTLSDNPENGSTDLTLTGGSGGGGATSTYVSFLQPVAGGTQSISLTDASAAVQFKTSTISKSDGTYVGTYTQTSASFVSPVTLLKNNPDSTGIAPTTSVLSGATVTFSGSTLPNAAQAPLSGQSTVALAGLTTSIYGDVTHYFTDLSSLAPYGPGARQIVAIDGYSAQGDGGAGLFYWDTSNLGALTGTATVSNGSPSVTFSVAQTLPAGTPFVFGTDTTQYLIQSTIRAATSGTLTTNYGGSLTGAHTATRGQLGDGGTRSVVAGPAGAWARLVPGDFFSAAWFGMTGNGSTDDAAACQACVNGAYLAGKSIVLFPLTGKAANGATIVNLSKPIYNPFGLTLKCESQAVQMAPQGSFPCYQHGTVQYDPTLVGQNPATTLGGYTTVGSVAYAYLSYLNNLCPFLDLTYNTSNAWSDFDGLGAMTASTTTATYIQPAVGSSVVIAVANAGSLSVGNKIRVSGSTYNGAQSPGGRYTITGIASLNVTATLNSHISAAANQVIASGSIVQNESVAPSATTATFVQPGQGGTVSVTMASTAGYLTGTLVGGGQGGTYFVTSITDATHMVLTGQWVPVGGIAPGGTVPIGTVISPSGLTVSMYIDPITNLAGGAEIRVIEAMAGSRGLEALQTVFLLACTDIYAAGNYLSIIFTTGGTGQVLLNLSANPLPAGTKTHIVMCYNGVDVRLFVAGVLAGTVACIGGIKQPDTVSYMMGVRCQLWPLNGAIDNSGNGFLVGGKAVNAFPLYHTTFTPPTIEPVALGQGDRLILNFSSSHLVTVPAPGLFTDVIGGGTNLAAGWVRARTNTDGNVNAVDSWFRWDNSVDNYVGGDAISGTLEAIGTPAIQSNAVLYSVFDGVSIAGRGCGIDLCNFSYQPKIARCNIRVGTASTRCASWAIGLLAGAQFVVIEDFTFANANWAIVASNDVSVKQGYILAGLCGFLYAGHLGDPYFSIRLEGVAVVDDGGSASTVATVYVSAVNNFVWEGGSAEVGVIGGVGVPQFIVDGVTNMRVDCVLGSGVAATPLFQVGPNQTQPIHTVAPHDDGIPGNVTPIMPETGSTGQGLILVDGLEESGVTVLAVTGNHTLLVVEHENGTLVLTGSPGADFTITTPAFAGWTRTVINQTGQTCHYLPNGGTVGVHNIDVAAGAKVVTKSITVGGVLKWL